MLADSKKLVIILNPCDVIKQWMIIQYSFIPVIMVTLYLDISRKNSGISVYYYYNYSSQFLICNIT